MFKFFERLGPQEEPTEDDTRQKGELRESIIQDDSGQWRTQADVLAEEHAVEKRSEYDREELLLEEVGGSETDEEIAREEAMDINYIHPSEVGPTRYDEQVEAAQSEDFTILVEKEDRHDAGDIQQSFTQASDEEKIRLGKGILFGSGGHARGGNSKPITKDYQRFDKAA